VIFKKIRNNAMSNDNNRIVNDLGKRLLEAARLGNSNEVSNLMKNGAPLTTDWLGTTPLHLAAIYGHTETAEILIKSGISRDGRTKVDKVPMHFACQHGHIEIVKLLVHGGAHINAVDMLKMTPLHWAVEANNFEICFFLLKSGVRTSMKNKFDKTPLKIAEDKGFTSIIQLLSDKKLRVMQELNALHEKNIKNHSMSSVKICKPENFFGTSTPAAVLKKQKTRRFPMVAGTWTGGEAQTQERLEISERRIFRRKSFQKDDAKVGATFQPTTVNNVPVYEKNLTSLLNVNYAEGSPLQKLQETVQRQSMENKTLFTNQSEESNTDEHKSNPTEGLSFPSIALQYPSSVSSHLHQGIPVISSKCLNNLPDNVKAIPLNNSLFQHAKDLNQSQNNLKTNNNILSQSSLQGTTLGTSSATLASANTTFTNNSTDNPPTNEESQSTSVPVDIPVNLLQQIFGGNISLQNKKLTAASEFVNYSNSENKLVGINTEMGTIPILPVCGTGGFQLIPLENETDSPSILNQTYSQNVTTQSKNIVQPIKNLYSTMQNMIPTNPSIVQQPAPSGHVMFPAPSSHPYSMAAAANLSMLAAHHGGFDTASAILQAQRHHHGNHLLAAGSHNPVQIASGPQLIMPNGLVVQHQPAGYQPYYPAYYPMPTMFQPAQTLIQPSIIPTAMGQPPSFYHPQMAPSLFQGQSVYLQPPPQTLQPQLQPYLFLDASGGLHSAPKPPDNKMTLLNNMANERNE